MSNYYASTAVIAAPYGGNVHVPYQPGPDAVHHDADTRGIADAVRRISPNTAVYVACSRDGVQISMSMEKSTYLARWKELVTFEDQDSFQSCIELSPKIVCWDGEISDDLINAHIVAAALVESYRHRCAEVPSMPLSALERCAVGGLLTATLGPGITYAGFEYCVDRHVYRVTRFAGVA